MPDTVQQEVTTQVHLYKTTGQTPHSARRKFKSPAGNLLSPGVVGMHPPKDIVMAVRASKSDTTNQVPPTAPVYPNSTFPVFPPNAVPIHPPSNNTNNSTNILNQPLRRKYVDVFNETNLDDV